LYFFGPIFSIVSPKKYTSVFWPVTGGGASAVLVEKDVDLVGVDPRVALQKDDGAGELPVVFVDELELLVAHHPVEAGNGLCRRRPRPRRNGEQQGAATDGYRRKSLHA
jgi:hypothetical protein